jgi:predicted ATPase
MLGLPFQPTPFIGRGAELTELARILAAPTCRLLTLLGPGGIGKTRLAIEAAAGQTAAFRDGVAFVALASVRTHNQIVSAIGDTLGLSFAGQPNPTVHLLGALRARHMLLILDSFEHLLASTDLVSDILAEAPQVTILVTSHERLNLQAEWLFDVEGLAYPPEDPHMPVAALTDYSAVQLFVQRVTQVQPGFSLPEATLATIARICRHVAGMPLAIELAAAEVRNVPIALIEQQIRASLDGLATTLRDVPARHRSMRAVFDHSWNLLSEPERMLFSQLAIFRGGWTIEAAEAVAAQLKIENAELKNTSHEYALLNSQLTRGAGRQVACATGAPYRDRVDCRAHRDARRSCATLCHAGADPRVRPGAVGGTG